MSKVKPRRMVPVIGYVGPGQVIHLNEERPKLEPREKALIEAFRNLSEVQNTPL